MKKTRSILLTLEPEYVGRQRYVVPPSLNARMHWAARKRVADQFKNDAMWKIRALGAPKYAKATINFTIHRMPMYWQDQDNAYASMKPIIDAIVKAGLIPDDSQEYAIMSMRQKAVEHRDNERIEVVIKEET
jgi:Holliday junction resolvase RusA-like endonuclease